MIQEVKGIGLMALQQSILFLYILSTLIYLEKMVHNPFLNVKSKLLLKSVVLGEVTKPSMLKAL